MAYQVLIDSVDRTSLIMSESLNVQPRADNRSDCGLTFETTAAVFTPKVGQEIQVKDGAETIFGGIIKTAPMERVGVGLGATTPIFVSITSDGYSSITARRTITSFYLSKTCGFIVADYVTKFLAAEGITAGTINAGVTLSSYIKGAMSLKESLDELAGLSGFKWYIDDAKALHFLQEDTITAAAHDIVEGGVFTDFRDVRAEEQLDMYRNKQVILGGTLEDGGVLVYAKQLDTEIAARILADGYGTGVYGNVFEDSNILTEADAEVVADNLLKKYGKVPITLSFNSDATDWRAGTKLLVNLPTLGISSNTYFLIEEVSITDIGAGNLRSFISATRRDDASFSTQRSGNYIDYFADLVRVSKGGGSGGSGASSQFISVTDDNSSLVTLTTVSQEILEVMFALPRTRTLLIKILAPVTVDESCLITAVCEVDTVAVRTFQEYYLVDANEDSKKKIFDTSFALESVAASASKKVTVKMYVSSSTAEIAANAAQLTVSARGIELSTTDLTPSIELNTLTSPSSDISLATAVASDTPATITPTTLAGLMATDPSLGSFAMYYARFETGDDSQLGVYGDNWEGQTFTPGASHTANEALIKAYRIGDPGTVTVEIYETSSNLPTGAAIASGTFTGTDLNEITAGSDWKAVSLGAGVALTASTKYALVVRASSPANEGEAWLNMGALTNVSLSANRTYGWSFTVSANRDVTHLSIYPRNSATFKLHLWDGAGNLLADVTDACTANTWNHLALASAVSLTAATTYVVSFNYPTGTNYHYRNAPAAAEFHPEVTFGQGRYATAHDTYPATAETGRANGVLGFKLDAPGRVMWRNDASAPDYSGGARVISTTGGASWSEDLTRDFMFKEGDV